MYLYLLTITCELTQRKYFFSLFAICNVTHAILNTANIFAFSWKWSMRFLESWQILVLTSWQMRLLLYIFCFHQYVKKSVRFCPSADFHLLRLITVVTSHIGWWPLLGTRINSFVLFSTAQSHSSFDTRIAHVSTCGPDTTQSIKQQYLRKIFVKDRMFVSKWDILIRCFWVLMLWSQKCHRCSSIEGRHCCGVNQIVSEETLEWVLTISRSGKVDRMSEERERVSWLCKVAGHGWHNCVLEYGDEPLVIRWTVNTCVRQE